MPAYRPELHGIAERWNRTVTKMANSMLYASRLSYILWPSAMAHANTLKNRLPVQGLGALTPYEIFYGKRPRVDTLRVFGCDAYRLLPTYPRCQARRVGKGSFLLVSRPTALGGVALIRSHFNLRRSLSLSLTKRVLGSESIRCENTTSDVNYRSAESSKDLSSNKTIFSWTLSRKT